MTDKYTALADEAAASLEDDGYSANLVQRLEHAVRELMRMHVRAADSFCEAIIKVEKERDQAQAHLERRDAKANQLMQQRDEARAKLAMLELACRNQNAEIKLNEAEDWQAETLRDLEAEKP